MSDINDICPQLSAPLKAAAERLIAVYEHEQRNAPSEEKKRVERLVAKLKEARAIARELSPTNQARFLNNAANDPIAELIEAAQAIDAEPLPKKRQRENMHHAIAHAYYLTTRRKPTSGHSREPSEYEQFMGAIICCLDGLDPDHLETAIEKGKKQASRAAVVAGQFGEN